MQGNDYVMSRMYLRGVTCFACHDVHGTEYEADLIRPGNDVCLDCHGPTLQAGPPGSIEFHAQHEAGREGTSCMACHMPAIAATIADVNVRSHTFKFISPVLTGQSGVPNACTSCHTDRTNMWAIEALRQWPSVSPWRVAP
jgi:predicted CXXCH cytochrome family protein